MNLIVSQLYSPSLEFILLIIATLISLFLAAAVYIGNPKSATNRIFSVLTLSTTCWLILTYISRSPNLFYDSLTLHRLGIFFAAPMSASFFLLAHTMPSESIQLKKITFRLTILGTLLMMLLNISPYAFVDVVSIGGISQPQPGFGLIPFTVLSTIFSVLAVYWLLRRFLSSTEAEKSQRKIVLIGMLIMLTLIITTVLVPIVLWGSVQFLAFTPLYALVFLGMSAYAITKYQLFSMKVLVTQALTLTICLVLFAKIFGEESFNAQVIDGVILVFTGIFAYFLVQSVSREVRQREKIEIQEAELQKINSQQEGLLHFISHEIKGYLTKSQAAFAGIIDGDYGSAPPAMQSMAHLALNDTRKGVATVMDILDASNLKKGTVNYNKSSFNICNSLEQVVQDLNPQAQERHLTLHLDKGRSNCTVFGDEDKLTRHVLRNVIDNSVKYTTSGRVDVGVTKNEHTVRITVKDTGVGISPEDMSKLFTEGGHGADSIKFNVHSTGYGLYIAKTITEAHGGKIWATSEGKDKGSLFTIELPAST